jgi:hypothetical protein
MFKKIVLGFTATLACSTAFAAPEWVAVGLTKDDRGAVVHFELKSGSMQIYNKDNGAPVVFATMREFVPGGNYQFALVGFPVSACVDGMGQLVLFDMQGNITSKHDVVSRGGTVGSDIFDTMCGALKAAGNKPTHNSTDL